MGNGRGAEIIKIIHWPRKNIPGPVDDQRSEKDRPPQSGGCNSGTSLLRRSVLFLVAMTKKLL